MTTPLSLIEAIQHKKPLNEIKTLIDQNAKIDEKNNGGYTALILASRDGYTEIVELLLDHNAKIDEKNNDGYTALILASRYEYTEIVKLLQSHLKYHQLQLFLKLSKLLHTSLEILSLSTLFQKLIRTKPSITFSNQYNLLTYLKHTNSIIQPPPNQIRSFLISIEDQQE